MMMEAIITNEYGEVGFGSRKRDGWALEIAFFVDGDEDPIDRHYPKTMDIATQWKTAFEAGQWYLNEYGGVEFEMCQ
jgi:hypothetical protein